jgi:lysophospholipase L1-like esterase
VANHRLATPWRLGYDPARVMRLLRIGAATAGVLVLLLLLLELLFFLGGLVVRGEPTAAADGSIVVLCVGDSHTRGRKDPDNYPFQLERMLNERTGKHYRVVNLGIPGQNTAQVRSRLERYLTYYRPAIVLHFGGVNNAWNHIETDVWNQSLLRRLMERSRVLRFARVALFYGRLAKDTYETPAIKLTQWSELDRSSYHVNFGGVEEDIATAAKEAGARLPEGEVERVTRQDFAALMLMAADRRIPMFLVMYPLRDLVFEPVNRMVERVSAEFHVPYVDSPAAVRALGERKVDELYDSWAHPTPLLYTQIAEEAYALLVRQGLVTPAPSAPGEQR